MTVFEILNLRSEFEDIILNYKIPGAHKNGTISGLKWFKTNAQKSNKRKDGFDRADEIATLILDNV